MLVDICTLALCYMNCSLFGFIVGRMYEKSKEPPVGWDKNWMRG